MVNYECYVIAYSSGDAKIMVFLDFVFIFMEEQVCPENCRILAILNYPNAEKKTLRPSVILGHYFNEGVKILFYASHTLAAKP